MDTSDSTNNTFLHRLLRVSMPTLFIWILTFEWIARAHPGVQTTARILYILLATIWLIQRWRRDEPVRISRLGIVLLLYFLYTALLIPLAPLSFHSFEVELSYVFYLLIFIFFLNETQSESKLAIWHFAFLQSAIVFTLFNLLLVARWWRQWLDISGSILQLPPFGFRLPGLFLQHPNVEAAYLNLILPFLFVAILRSRKTSRIVGLSSLLVLFLISSFFASSRGAWLATVGSLSAVVLLYYWEPIMRSARQLMRKRRMKLSLRSVVIILAGSVVIAGIGLLSFQQARFGGHGRRLDLWTIAWDIFNDAPLIGNGPGSFHVLAATKAGIPPGFYLVHAHNLVLQILGETGLMGMLFFLGMILVTFRSILNAWANHDQKRIDLIACIAALVGMMTHQLVDFAFEAPLYSVGVLFLLARLSLFKQSTGSQRQRQLSKVGLPLLLLLSYGAGNLVTLRGAQDNFDGVSAAKDGEWEHARELICQARDRNGWLSLFQFQCGFASAMVSTIGEREPYLDEALSAYTLGISEDPYWPYNKASTAAMLWSNGKHEESLNLMLLAYDQAPRSSVLALNLAYMYASLNQVELAESFIKVAFELDPWLWRSAQEPWKPPGEALDAYNQEELKGKLFPASYHTLQGWLLIDAYMLDEVKEEFELALSLDPASVDATAGLAYLALQEGDEVKAANLIQSVELTGRNTWIVEEVKGEIAAASGDLDNAFLHWNAATRLRLITSSLEPYYESVYTRAYIPIDFPPQVIQPSLPASLSNGFLRAMGEGSDLVKSESAKLLPWFESQIHLRDSVE